MINDNGIGFEPQFSEQIFGLFQRLHGKDEYPGTGIGLSICKKIIENHDGFITACGKKGSGATFNIYVPTEEKNKIEKEYQSFSRTLTLLPLL
jgi:light-regulated signal transduction histidine kinase (bacteriophytochrome)